MLDQDKDWIQNHPLDDVAERFQRKLNELSNIADDNKVHFLVTVDSLPAVTVGHSDKEQEQDVVMELNPCDEYYRRFKALSAKARSMAPSKASKSKEYANHQSSADSAIHDGMYAPRPDGSPAVVTIAPPVELFHPVFAQFLDNIHNPSFEPDLEAIKTVSDLMTTSSAISTSESTYAKNIRQHLTRILCRYVGKSGMTDNDRIADGRIALMLPDMDITLVLAELKRALGEGGSDALMQASISVLNNWNEDTRADIRNRTCCPTFLVAGGGPYLAILAVIWTDKFVVQRLTDLMWLGEARTSEDPRIYQLARAFMALRECIPTLEAFYKDIYKERHTIPEPKLGVPHPRFFPYPNQFRSPTRNSTFTPFNYLRPLESDFTCVTFLAETTMEPKHLLVVKFVDRYGHEVHDHMAKHDKAPALHYCGLLDGETDSRHDAKACSAPRVGGLYDGPWRMVVMDYVKGVTAEEATPEQWPCDAYKQLESIMKDLHGKGYVFGDLRKPNVMFMGQKVLLIDFDWAGKDGEVCYPKGVAVAPGRASGCEFRFITKGDDNSMLDSFRRDQVST